MRILLIMISLLCSQAFAQPPETELDVLKNIRSYLKSNSSEVVTEPGKDEFDTIMDKSWGNANLLSALDPFDYKSTDLLESILKNNSSDKENIISTIQTALDAITYDLTVANDDQSVKDYNTDHAASVSTTLPAHAADYRKALKLSDQVKSCLIYWNAGGEETTIADPTRGKVLEAYAMQDKIAKTLEQFPTKSTKADAQTTSSITQLECKFTTSGNKFAFNGWDEIKATTLTPTSSPKVLTELSSEAINALAALKNSDDSTAENDLKSLDLKLDSYVTALQNQVAEEIKTALNLKSGSLVQILTSSNTPQAPQASLPNCSGKEIATINDNNTNLGFASRCNKADPVSNTADSAVKALTAVINETPFKRGLSRVKVGQNKDQYRLLIAGQYLTFKPHPKKAIFYVSSESQTIGNTAKHAFIDQATISKIDSARSSIESGLDPMRDGFAQLLMKETLKTNGARSILQGIKDIRYNKNTYSNGSQVFDATPAEVLQHNATWRLQATGNDQIGNGSWINRISTMENGNLLRELLILQAQMLQMQYSIYADQQKLLALSATQVETDPELLSYFGTQSVMLGGTIIDYLSGVKGISGKTPADMEMPSSDPSEALATGGAQSQAALNEALPEGAN